MGSDQIDCTEDWLRFPQNLHEWIKRKEMDAGISEGVTSREAQRIKELGCEVKKLRRDNESTES